MSYLMSWVVLLGIVSLGMGQTIMQRTCSAKGKVTIQDGAQAYIGEIDSLRVAGTGGFGCGGLFPYTMQSYEAMRWALDRLNKKGEILNGQMLTDSYVPGVKIGMMVRDYCLQPGSMLSFAQEFFPQFQSESRDCSKKPSELMLGLIGTASSSHSKVLTSFTERYNIPLISYANTATELTEGNSYPHFLRTVSNDGPLMDAIVSVLQTLNWKYVVVVYTQDTYGEGALSEIRSRLAKNGICLTSAVPADPSDTSSGAAAKTLNSVLTAETVGVIFLGNSGVASALLQQGETHVNAGRLQWIFTDSIAVSDTFVGKKYPRGVICIQAGTRKVIEFEDHWARINITNPSSENPWFRDYWMTTYKCRLPDNTNPAFNAFPQCTLPTETERRSSYVQDTFVETAVHAVYSYAKALKLAHANLCGPTAVGLCDALKALSTGDFFKNYLKRLSFTYTKEERVESLASHVLEPYNAPAKVAFDENGDIVSPSYDVYNFNDYPGGSAYKFRKLGSYRNGRLEIVASRLRMYDIARNAALSPPPASPCPSAGCKPCLGLPMDPKYLYVPGDVIINGIFSIHKPGTTPLSCGAWNNDLRSGILYMEGMVYALNEFNKLNVLKGVKLGGLAFDDCMDSVLGTHFVTEVQRGTLAIKDASGKMMDYKKIEAYTGAYGSTLTIPLSKLMNDIKKPLLGYAAVSSELADDPYYLYMHYNTEMYVKAMIYLLKRNGWNYVQVIKFPNVFLQDAADLFRKMAAKEGICVVATYDQTTEAEAKTVLSKLESQASVKPVIVFNTKENLQKLLSEVKNQNKMGKFVFITRLSNYESMKGYEAESEGLLSVGVSSPSVNNFVTYLNSLRPNVYKTNPWFNEWYENMFNCSLDSSNMRSYMSACKNTATSQITDGKLFQLYPAFATIYATYAVGYGLHSTLVEYCGASYSGLCGKFINAAEKGKVLLEKIKQVSVDINGFRIQFNKNMLNLPLDFFNYRSGAYIKVGTFNDLIKDYFLNLGQLTLPGGVALASATPSCSGVCQQCLYMFAEQKYMYIPGDLIIPGIFDVHYPGPNQYTCGDIRNRNGFLNTEVVAYALNKINSGMANITLSNVTLGSLIFDGCMDRMRGRTLASALYYGLYPTKDGRALYPSDKLMGLLTYDSGTTIDAATMLMNYGLPSISPGATSPVLDDKTLYKTFFRTIPSDGVTALAMANVAKEMGFKYIITLNAPEQGSRDAVEVFKKHARINGICIGASYEFVTDGSMDTLIGYIADSSTRVVAVFSDPDRYITDLLKAKSVNANAGNIVFMANRAWNSPLLSRTSLQYADETITFGQKFPKLVDFRDYLSKKFPDTYTVNPWFSEFYQDYFSCNLPGKWKFGNVACNNPSGRSVVDNNFVEDFTALPTIHAVYSLAESIHRTLKEKCGATYSGVCSKFLTSADTFSKVMGHMDTMQVNDVLGEMFKFIQRESNRGISIDRIKAGTIINEGGFKETMLTLRDRNDLVAEYAKTPSSCVGDCAQCYILGDGSQDFTFYSGDVLFVGLFDINKKGQTPYSCGEVNDKHGFQLLEAFHFALEYANNRNGMFSNLYPGVAYGGVALDVCQNPTRAGNLVANLHNGNIKLVKDGITINPDRFDVYIGTLESESTVRVADVVNPLGIPQISYGATSLELSNSYKYNYFVRTVPADDKQARGIISYLKRFKLSNVQVITSFNSVGQYAEKEFSRLAKLNRICVSQNVRIGHSGIITNTDAQTAINSLFLKPDASVVVLFVDDPSELLKVIESNAYVRGNFTFIGTDKLGFDREKWDLAKSLAKSRRAVSLDIETADVPDFDAFFETKVPNVYNKFNPWFDEYYQYIFRCNLPGKGTKYSEPCPSKLMGVPRSKYYVQDPYLLYVINAVFSAVLGADAAIKKMCPVGGLGVCNIFVTSGEKRQEIMNGIRAVRFTDTTKQPFYYEPDGDSSRGYHIWEALPATSISKYTDYMLEDVGSYNDTHHLKIDARYDIDWKSNCSKPGSCVCEFPEYKPSRYMKSSVPHNLYVVYMSDVHKIDKSDPFKCGPIDTMGGFQNLMAFFYALDLVNSNVKLPSTLKLGGIAVDTCSAPYRIGQDIYSLLSGEGICESSNVGQIVAPSDLVTFITTNSQNSIAVSRILSPLKYTTLSNSATSVLLSDKSFHEYFLRTVPPDNIQAIVIAEVLKKFAWDYVSAVYSDNAYGKSGINTLLSATENQAPRSCISQTIAMKTDATLNDAKDIVDQLNRRVGAQVVVLFVTAEHAKLLLQATTERGLTHRFVWFGSDAWADSQYITNGYEDAAAGALTIQIRSEAVESFKTYLKSFDINNRMNLPQDWFEDLYQTLHQCRILNSKVPKSYATVCSGDEKVTDAMLPGDPFTLHTMIAVHVIAEGLNSIEVCKRTSLSLSACLSLQADKKDLIFNGIKKVQYPVLPDLLKEKSFLFKFVEQGYGDIGYNILNYRRNSVTGKYSYVKIGTYQQSVTLDNTLYQGFSIVGSRTLPLSQCPVGSTCLCLNSNGTKSPYSRQDTSGASYYVLDDGRYVDSQTGEIVQLESTPNITDRFLDIWGTIVATLAGIGLFISLCIFIYLLVVYPVRGGTSILGFILSFGIILLYGMVFAFIVHANKQVCGVREFCLGLVYAICYSSLFIKLVDCWRSRGKNELYEVKYEKLGRPLGFFFCCCLLVSIQVVINAEWLILQEPDMERVLYNKMLWARCTPNDFYDESLILSLVYVMCLVILSVIFGLMAWNNAKNHHEARWILGIAVLSVPVWIVFCVVATMGEYKTRDAAVAIGLLVNATVMLALGPVRKLFLLSQFEVKMEEEEKRSSLGSQREGDYASMYGRQYDNLPRLHDSDSMRGSMMGNEYVPYGSQIGGPQY